MKCCCSNRNSKEKSKRGLAASKNKNRSQKNIFNSSHTININDDIIMKDENINPNINTNIVNNNQKIYSTKTTKNNLSLNKISKVSSFVEDTTDIDMKIENIIYHEIKPKKEPKKNEC